MAPIYNLTLLGLVIGTCTLVCADGIYTKNSPVIQVNAKNYDSLIAQSNHTSILEFYAPWCGHCQNLKPAYEKAAKNLAGLAKVAAINCDEEPNKPLCGQMGVQGFPTLKIIKPGSKPGRPVVEDYQGPRTAKGIVDAVVDKIPNHVKRLSESGLDAWLADTTTKAKAILFTEKSTTSALIKSLAVDYLGSISVGQVRSKEATVVDKYGITKFPTIVLMPGDGQEPVLYSDAMNREALVAFLSKVASPNPDPAPKKVKPTKSTKDAKSSAKSASVSASFSRASEAHKSSDLDDFLEASTIILDENTPTDSPLPIVETEEKPIAVPEAIPELPILSVASELDNACLQPKSGTCGLLLLPSKADSDTILPEAATKALHGFAEIAEKHHKRRANIFPFYGVSTENERAKSIRNDLGLDTGDSLQIIAINNKRGWWRQYRAESYETIDIEGFVDAILFGEGPKSKLPERFGEANAPTEASKPSAEPEHNEL